MSRAAAELEAMTTEAANEIFGSLEDQQPFYAFVTALFCFGRPIWLENLLEAGDSHAMTRWIAVLLLKCT